MNRRIRNAALALFILGLLIYGMFKARGLMDSDLTRSAPIDTSKSSLPAAELPFSNASRWTATQLVAACGKPYSVRRTGEETRWGTEMLPLEDLVYLDKQKHKILFEFRPTLYNVEFDSPKAIGENISNSLRQLPCLNNVEERRGLSWAGSKH
jgi:hypothetical protein